MVMPSVLPQLKGSQSLLRPVKDKVRSEVKGRKLRLEEFFLPFDLHNNKKVWRKNNVACRLKLFYGEDVRVPVLSGRIREVLRLWEGGSVMCPVSKLTVVPLDSFRGVSF